MQDMMTRVVCRVCLITLYMQITAALMDKTQSMVAKFDCRVHFNHLLRADLTEANEQGARPFDQI